MATKSAILARNAPATWASARGRPFGQGAVLLMAICWSNLSLTSPSSGECRFMVVVAGPRAGLHAGAEVEAIGR